MSSAPSLHHDRIVSDRAAPPGKWLSVLHGIYGAGRNWATVVRRVVSRRPEWGGVTVDLREHGESVGFPPPHTVDAAAGDVVALLETEGLAGGAVLGHSFGGKVALRAASLAPALVKQVWVVDSTPEAREPDGAAWEMLDVLKSTPGPFADRGAGTDALRERGVATPVARWMATNLVEGDHGWRWRIDPGSMEALLRDFFGTDAWDVVESPPEGVEVHLVKAEGSPVLSGEALERAERAAAHHDRVHLHRLPGGHWLNADNPDGVVGLLVGDLPG